MFGFKDGGKLGNFSNKEVLCSAVRVSRTLQVQVPQIQYVDEVVDVPVQKHRRAFCHHPGSKLVTSYKVSQYLNLFESIRQAGSSACEAAEAH